MLTKVFLPTTLMPVSWNASGVALAVAAAAPAGGRNGEFAAGSSARAPRAAHPARTKKENRHRRIPDGARRAGRRQTLAATPGRFMDFLRRRRPRRPFAG